MNATSSARYRVLNDLRIVGAGGTNKVMAGELSRLCRRALDDVRLPEPKKSGTGALIYPFEPRVARVAVLYHRTSVRVLWDVLETRAERLEPLYEDVLAAANGCERFLWDGARLSVYAHNVQEFAAGERQIVGTVKNALIEAAARKGMSVTLDPEAPSVIFVVRWEDGVTRVSVDLAGRPMNQRGYRRERVIAPLREDLAAVMLMLSRYDARKEFVLDVFTGSGTIAIEAACMAQALPVWTAGRKPLLVDMPMFAQLPPPGDVGLFADTQACVIATDIDAQLRPIAERSAVDAGVRSSLITVTSDFRDLGPRRVRQLLEEHGRQYESGLIIGNPPYGERLGRDGGSYEHVDDYRDEYRADDESAYESSQRSDRELFELYAELGDYCSRFSGCRAAFIVANRDFERAFGREPRVKKPLRNGPLPAYFYLYEL